MFSEKSDFQMYTLSYPLMYTFHHDTCNVTCLTFDGDKKSMHTLVGPENYNLPIVSFHWILDMFPSRYYL